MIYDSFLVQPRNLMGTENLGQDIYTGVEKMMKNPLLIRWRKQGVCLWPLNHEANPVFGRL
jgi:hypothetical protein